MFGELNKATHCQVFVRTVVMRWSWITFLVFVHSVHCNASEVELDWASSPHSPFAVRSSEYVEILKPENNATLNNQSAFIELKAEFSAGEQKELCVSLVNTKLDEVEASQCFSDDKIQNVIFDNLEVGGILKSKYLCMRKIQMIL